MNHSETISNLAAALVKAASEMPSVTKNATNPAFRSKFANLDGIIDTVKPVLAAHDLAVFQSVGESAAGTVRVETMLLHKSGEWLMSAITMPLAKNDPQGVGSAITYGRRYGLSAALSLATDEDDDANAASQTKAARQPSATPATDRQRAGLAKPKPSTDIIGNALVVALNTEVRGKRLADHTTDELAAMLAALRAEGNTKHKNLLADVSLVFNARPEEDRKVAAMKAGVEADGASLPFAGAGV